MKVIITVECDNSAFGDMPHYELSRILHYESARIHREGVNKVQKVLDINGNDVGSVIVIGEAGDGGKTEKTPPWEH